MTAQTEIPPGGTCAAGGVEVETGIDENGNGTLDDDEVDDTTTICNGSNALTSVEDVAPGEQCPEGGTRVEAGTDNNGNGSLDAAEVTSSALICAGASALTDVVDVSPGAECVYGGTRVESGIDQNGNGLLEESEISSSQLLCGTEADGFAGIAFAGEFTMNDWGEIWAARFSGESRRVAAAQEGHRGIASAERSPSGELVAYETQASASIDAENRLFIVDLKDEAPPVEVPLEVGATVTEISDLHWSPDGSRIAFRANIQGQGRELYTVFADGLGLLRVNEELASGESVADYAWHPDSSRIAYSARHDGQAEPGLYIVSLEGSRNRTEVRTAPDLRQLEWAPDGSRLAYWSQYATDGSGNELYELRTALPDGTDDVVVNGALIPSGTVARFSWSPDSSRIAYKAEKVTLGDYGLYTVAPPDGDPVNVSAQVAAGNDVGAFAWAPDGSRIAFETLQSGGVPGMSESGLFIFDTDAREATEVLASGTVGSLRSLVWSPDGGHLAYLAGDQYPEDELYAVQADGSGNVRITADFASAATSSPFRWAPDSSRLLYPTGDISIAHELRTANPDGTDRLRVDAEQGSGSNEIGGYGWVDNGDQIAFELNQSSEPTTANLVDRDGSNRREVGPDTEVTGPGVTFLVLD